MSVGLKIPPIALLLIAMVLVPGYCIDDTKTQITLSMMVMEKMVRGELKFLEELRSFFKFIGLGKKPKLNKFLKKQTAKALERNKTGFDELYFKHPNSIFNIVKELSQDYSWESDSLGSYYEDFQDFLEYSHNIMADEFDTTLTAWVLLVLQELYDLTPEAILKGDYLGFKGPELMPSDVIDLGKRALYHAFLNASLEWLRLGLLLKSQATNQPPESDGHIKALMGQVFLMKNESDRAKDFYNEALQLDPKDNEVFQLGRELQGVNEKNMSDFEQLGEDFKSIKHLCTLEPGQHTDKRKSSKNFCRYREALLPYNLYKEEILSRSPLVFVIYNIVTDGEGQAIQDFVKDEMYPATVANGYLTLKRTASVGVMGPQDAADLNVHLEKRIELVTRLDVDMDAPSESYHEPMQIVNYAFGGYYLPHLDAPELTETGVTNGTSTRLLTCLVYLNEVEKGGATVFPELNISVFPIKNMALMWYNLNPAGQLEQDTLHAGCPVAVGHKWIVTKWIWSPGSIHRQCGMSVSTTNFELEIERKGAYR